MVADRDRMDPDDLPASIYRRLVEVALDVITLLDSEGRVRFVNEAVYQVLGYPPADVVGRPIEDFFHPDDKQRAVERLQKTLSERDAGGQTEIFRLRHRNGSYRHLESLAVSRLDDPEVGGIYLIARDVTARLAAEAERAIIQTRRELAAQVARFGIWEWNCQTNELIASEAVRDFVRAEPGQHWTDPDEFLKRFLPDDRGPMERALQDAAAGRPTEGLVARMPLPDGALRWLYMHVQNRQPGGPPSPWLLGLVMDVTAQKRAEQEIERREEMLELATWGANVGVWTWLPYEDRSVYNKRCAELLGIPTRELECTTAALYEPVHPDDLPEMKRREAELLAGKTDVFDYAYRARQDEAGWHWVMDRGRVSERDADGRVTRVSGVTLDIDEAKRRERELNDQRLRLDLALDASRLGLWDFDLARDELFVDQRYTDIVGLHAGALHRQYVEFVRHIHEDDRPRLLAAWRECLEGRASTLSFEGRLLRPDARMIWVHVEGFVARRHDDGRPARIIGTLADVSERVREQQLIRAGELVAGIGSIAFELGAGPAYWSEGAYRVFELPGDFVPRGDTIRSLLLPQGRSAAREAFRAAEEEGRDFDFEAEASTATGRRIWVRLIGRVDSFRGRPVRVHGIVQDVTERRRLEDELLEAANREQQKLGSDLHDGLGQELTGISLLLQGLGQQVKAANPSLTGPFDRISSLLSRAIRNTRSLAHGLVPVSFERGGLETALRTLAEQVTASQAVAVNLEFHWDEGPVLGDAAGNHVYRIVQESVSNAVRHGLAGNIDIRIRPMEESLVLEVQDDGRGIGDDALLSGGFGLRSMRYRAQAIGGTLSIHKVPGGGTRIRLLCPRPVA
jgi:PAS domain S-box-containing protein